MDRLEKLFKADVHRPLVPKGLWALSEAGYSDGTIVVMSVAGLG